MLITNKPIDQDYYIEEGIYYVQIQSSEPELGYFIVDAQFELGLLQTATLKKLQEFENVSFFLDASSLPKQMFDLCLEVNVTKNPEILEESFTIIGSNKFFIPNISDNSYEFISSKGIRSGDMMRFCLSGKGNGSKLSHFTLYNQGLYVNPDFTTTLTFGLPLFYLPQIQFKQVSAFMCNAN